MMLATALLAIALAASGAEDRWPQYRGPGGGGVAESAAPVEFGLKQNVVWTVPAGSGHSSPSIWGDHLFLTSFDGTSKELAVTAYDRRNGRVRWRQAIPATEIEKVHAVSSPATATPVVDGERVYAYFGSAGLFCYDFDGKLVWSKPMPAANVRFGSGTSPVMTEHSLVLARDDGERHMLAFERQTGKLLWDVKLGGNVQGHSGHATPVIWKDQIVLHRPGEVAGYDARNGSRLWWVSVGSQGTGTPAVYGDALFVGAWGMQEDLRDPIPSWDALVKHDKDGNGKISKDEFPGDLAGLRRVDAGNTPGAIVTFKQFFAQLDSDKDGEISKAEWEFVLKFISQPPPMPHGFLSIRLGGENDLTKTNVAWSDARAVPEVPAPLVYRDRVYTVTNGGIVSVFEQASGKLVYRGRLGAGGLYYSSPIAAGGHVYFASGEGAITVVRAGDKLEVVARNDLGEPIFATPAVVQGKLYIRTTARLHAFGR